MTVRTLKSPPGLLGLYAQAAAPLIPGSSLLPFIGGGGGEIPDLELELPGVRVDPTHLSSYTTACSLTMREWLPATYPHVLAFPLHMALMTDSSFPFGAIGLVHISNTITQHRPLSVEEELDLKVRATPLEDHPRGRSFSILSEAHVGGELVWEERSTMLRRGRAAGASADSATAEGKDAGGTIGTSKKEALPLAAEWRLPGDLGRRYAAASGDRNPIHLHNLTAKAFGFPRAIAHGMWTKARSLAALEQTLPGAFLVSVQFRRPILLPATVAFGSSSEGPATDFSVTGLSRGTPHLYGHLEPIEANNTSNGGRAK
jgi:hypothetical protein